MNSKFQIGPFLLGLVGAAAGGLVGYYGFSWLYSQGFYAMVLPGAAIGIGFNLACRQSSNAYGVVCAVLGIGLSIYIESQWYFYDESQSFTYLLTHVHELQPVSLLMIALGGVLAFWFGRGTASYTNTTPR